ncbi:CPBP family intramembrane glutamic endopeptidase [Natrinema salaciae]|uniref:Membrane protease YdiL, CAAX protease family n=1 Tax=Natrinema salaciae TaxID=1186196 RepID=A0A1H9SRD7_9EURY|nr:CPBP family intramembrane glutamic endopeptidase [Natrinema salaciae]SER86879.1 Membrane protease YdiL, CAAX protease family [Natrinema salaciae]
MNRRTVRDRVGRHPVVSFFVLAYAISWLGFLPSILGVDDAFGGLNLLVAQFGPAIAGGLVLWYTGGSIREWAGRIARWRVPLRWWAATIAIPIVIFGAADAGFALLGYVPDLSRLPDPLLTYLPTLVGLTLLAGLGEEPGWRGFALPRLQERYGPLGATLLLGTVWAVWHLPVFFVDPRSSHGIADPIVLGGMVLLTALGIVLYSFFYTWLYNHTGSVLLLMVLHGGFNTGTVHLVPFADELVFGPTYTTLLTVQVAALFVGVLALVALTRGRLGDDVEDERRRRGQEPSPTA